MIETLTLLLEWFPNPDHVPLFVGQEKGFFDAAGVSVALLTPTDPDDPLHLVAAGKVDCAINYQPNVIVNVARGVPVVSIGLLIDRTLDTIMYLKNSGIRGPADFRGKRIAFAVAPFDQVMFEVVAERAGLNRTDYEFVDVGFNFTRALVTGQVDVVMGAFRNFEVIEAGLIGADVDVIELAPHGVPDFYQLLLIAHPDLIERQPAAARGLVRGLAEAIRFTREQPEAAGEIFFGRNPLIRNELNTRAYAATLPYFAADQRQSPEKWAEVIAFLHERRMIDRPIDPATCFWPVVET